MRYFASVFLSLLCATFCFAEPLVKEGDVLALCGDSITEQRYYSVDIETYLLACQRIPNLRVVQFGWGGDSMTWFHNRNAERAILAFKPTIVTTCYGMNDGGYKPIERKTIETYRDGMMRLVQKLKDGGVERFVIGSPGAVDTHTFKRNNTTPDQYNDTLAHLRDAAKEVAEANGAVFANVHDAMLEAMAKAKAEHGPEYHVAGGDGFHPAANGHLVMAYAFLKALGCDGEIGTITVDLSSGQASASEGHTVLSNNDGDVMIESTRYPFCFFGDGKAVTSTKSIVEHTKFNEDLNRFRLIVKGAKSPTLKVTWGNSSKEFPAAELEQGINLAAELLDNPFSSTMKSLMDSVRKRQEYELTIVKQVMANEQTMREALQEQGQETTAVDQIINAMIQRDHRMSRDLQQTITPFTHSIRIEAVQ